MKKRQLTWYCPIFIYRFHERTLTGEAEYLEKMPVLCLLSTLVQFEWTKDFVVFIFKNRL